MASIETCYDGEVIAIARGATPRHAPVLIERCRRLRADVGRDCCQFGRLHTHGRLALLTALLPCALYALQLLGRIFSPETVCLLTGPRIVRSSTSLVEVGLEHWLHADVALLEKGEFAREVCRG